MILSGYQPQYFPRLHYLNRILNSDIFEISDYIQFVKKHIYELPNGEKKRGKSFQAHSPIKMSSGIHYLTLSLPDDLLPINKIKINYESGWVNKHLKTIETAYAKSLNFKKYFNEIENLLQEKYNSLSELNTATIIWQVLKFIVDDKLNMSNINLKSLNSILSNQKKFKLKKIVLTSETNVMPPNKGEANQWIINLCKLLKADTYFYGGTSSNAYMNMESFHKNNIKTMLQDWQCRPYSQQFQNLGFLPNLSALDLIMNESFSQRYLIIK